MIEEQLLNYGALGMWTATLLYRSLVLDKKREEKDDFRQKEMAEIIKNNTQVITKVYEIIKICNTKKPGKVYKQKNTLI